MKVRKIVAGLAAVSMLAAFSAQAVAAADTIGIKAGEATAKAGENFTLEISLEDVPAQGISAIEFAVSYDSKIATVTGVSAGKITETGVDATEKFDGVKGFEAGYDTAGLVTITYSTGLSDAQYCITESGVFATISGTVAEGAAAGDYDVTITAISRETVEGSGSNNTEVKAGYIDANGGVLKYGTTLTKGKITVTDGDVTPTETDEPTPTETDAPNPTETDAPNPTETDGPAPTETDKPVDPDKPTETEGTKVTPGDVSMYGDVNLDKAVDILDVIKLNKYLLGSAPLDGEGLANADVDVNKTVDSTDSLNILKCVVEMIAQTDFPL